MIGELFDPTSEFAIRETCKPHWSQAGAVTFITWRTCDSIPQQVLQHWHHERCEWLRRQYLLAFGDQDWKRAVENAEPELADAFRQPFDELRDRFLDQCHGACVMRDPELAQLVSESLLKFDGLRYRLGDFVVMPNHVHLLAAFPTEDAMKTQCTSWTRFTARQINARLGKSGHFWQTDPFDHLVRSPEQYEYLRKYIAENPKKANLKDGEFLYRKGPE